MTNSFRGIIRGEYDVTLAAGTTSFNVPVFDLDGMLLNLGSDQRLVISQCSVQFDNPGGTDVSVRVFFDSFGDGRTTGLAGPSTSHAPAGTTIGAGTYTFAVTFIDPLTGNETPVSATSAGVTVSSGDSITITAPVAIPAWMANAVMRVYRMDGGSVGLVGTSAAGSNTLTITSVAPGATQPPVAGATSGGKAVGAGITNANLATSSDQFGPPRVGPPGVGLKATVVVATGGTNIGVIIHIAGEVINTRQIS